MRDAEKIWMELMTLFLMEDMSHDLTKEVVSEKIMVDMEEIIKAEKMYE